MSDIRIASTATGPITQDEADLLRYYRDMTDADRICTLGFIRLSVEENPRRSSVRSPLRLVVGGRDA